MQWELEGFSLCAGGGCRLGSGARNPALMNRKTTQVYYVPTGSYALGPRREAISTICRRACLVMSSSSLLKEGLQ